MAGRVRDGGSAECVRPAMSAATFPPPTNLDVNVKVGDNACMSARIYPVTEPTAAEQLTARAVLKAARLARMRQRRAARRAGEANGPKFKPAAFLCGWCGDTFEARVLRRTVIGRYCSGSCRQLAYQHRKRIAARREAARAAILAGMEA
jgi:hypothetical protein